ncbi:MAG: DUF418 domain-containing protein [Sphingorhabdus sp.]|nr:DUF418 domain-containing protein [Sphingorhabdus sp.]
MMQNNGRHQSLDILRGFAVMGILAMNIVGFSMPDMAYINPRVHGGTAGADYMAWLLSFVLIDGKMRGLFALLFGASMMLIIANANQKQLDPGSIHYRRMFWLGLFGLAHYYFIWWGDILFAYAVSGSVAYLFCHLDSKPLIKWALIIYAAGFLLYSVTMGSLFYFERAANAPGATESDRAVLEDVVRGLGSDQPLTAKNIALHQSSYGAIASEKLTERTFDPIVNPLFFMLETLPMMLIGMAMLQNGFLLGGGANSALTKSYRKWAVWCLSAGLIWTGVCAYIVTVSGFDWIMTSFIQSAATLPARLLMTVGYIAALILVIAKYRESRFLARVAAAGRAAFTNYIGTSIVMTTIFYGYGLGYYGQLSRAELYWLLLPAWCIMLLWSKPWLERFHFGPLEWLWRSLARGKWQPMVRA